MDKPISSDEFNAPQQPAAPSAPVGADDALIAGAMEAAANACSRHVVCNEAIAAAVEYALAQQPAAPSAPVRVAGDGVDVDAIQHILRHALRDGVHGGYTAGFIENQIAALAAAHQQPAGVGGTATNSAVAAIQFALKDPEGMTFLRLWNEGEFDTLRREWPDAPVEVYINADPLAAQRKGGRNV